jgi:DNA polymerase-3 subunit beta
VGEARESVPVDFHRERLEIGFNAEFLRDGIDSVHGDNLRLRLISPLRPGLLQGDDESFSYLIMPIRLSS